MRPRLRHASRSPSHSPRTCAAATPTSTRSSSRANVLTALPRRYGGYSGPGVLPVALAKVDEVVQRTGVPVVGVGGIGDVGDALKFFALGAVAVQVGTAQMEDPFAAARIAAGLSGDRGR